MAKRTDSYNLEAINPDLAKQWHSLFNGDVTPKDVTPYSNKKYWWMCEKGHSWKAIVLGRNSGNGCPYCSGAAACEDNSLQSVNPKLAKEWHPTKNGNLTPNDVTPGSHKKVWWLCEKGHDWKAKIYSRHGGGGCPYCSGLRVSDTDCLQTMNRSLAQEWHPTKNGTLTPKDVRQWSRKKVWWICSKGHEWESTVANRSKGNGCPYCSGYSVCNDNCLQTVNPKLAGEWHPTKNGEQTPKDVTSGSSKKVWWICTKGHEWEAIINNRNRGAGCPYCSGRRK